MQSTWKLVKEPEVSCDKYLACGEKIEKNYLSIYFYEFVEQTFTSISAPMTQLAGSDPLPGVTLDRDVSSAEHSHVVRLLALWALSSWAEGGEAGPRRWPPVWGPVLSSWD